MARNKLGLVVLGMVVMFGATAAAQNTEVAGVVGRSFITDQTVSGVGNIHFGRGLTYEANISHRFIYFGLAAVSVEVPFVFDPTNKVHFGALNAVPKDFSSYFITPAARINLFPTTSFSPWVSIGGGYAHFNPNSTLEFGGANPNKSTSGGVFEVGGGLDVRIIGHFKLRGEIRDFNTSEPPINLNKGNRYSNLFAGAGLVFSF